MNDTSCARNYTIDSNSSLHDDRIRVSDGSYSKVEHGYRKMDKILASDRILRSKYFHEHSNKVNSANNPQEEEK